MIDEVFPDCSDCPFWPDECDTCRKFETETKSWADEEVETLRRARDD